MLIPERMDGSKLGSWKAQVSAHHAQSIGVMDLNQRPRDFWAVLASSFRDDPRRTDDPVLNCLLELADNNDTVLDVGGGAGRLAIPLAMNTRSTTVVEPSAGMVNQLQLAIRDAGVDNLNIIESDKEEIAISRFEDIDIDAIQIKVYDSCKYFIKNYTINDIPKYICLGAIIRVNQIIIPNFKTTIKINDELLLFLKQESINKAETLFQ